MRYLLSSLLCLVLVAVVTGCDAVDTADVPTADAATIEVLPLAVDFTNPCNGETIPFEGTSRNVTHVREDENGGFHFTFSQKNHLTGTGDQGNDYVANRSRVISLNVSKGETETRSFFLNIVGKGSAPNFKANLLQHITVDANGDVSTVFAKGDGPSGSCGS